MIKSMRLLTFDEQQNTLEETAVRIKADDAACLGRVAIADAQARKRSFPVCLSRTA